MDDDTPWWRIWDPGSPLAVRVVAWLVIGTTGVLVMLSGMGLSLGGGCVETGYRVDGSATQANLTMWNAQGGIEQQDRMMLPLYVPVGCLDEGQYVRVVAQNLDDKGTVRCRIEADGAVIAQSESSGAYVVTTCSAFVP